MASFRELVERYDELKDMTEEELTREVGSWWAQMFVMCKEQIELIKGGKSDA